MPDVTFICESIILKRRNIYLKKSAIHAIQRPFMNFYSRFLEIEETDKLSEESGENKMM